MCNLPKPYALDIMLKWDQWKPGSIINKDNVNEKGGTNIIHTQFICIDKVLT